MNRPFRNPFIPTTPAERDDMLARLGLSSAAELFENIPDDLRYPAIDMPAPLSEMEFVAHMRHLAAQNLSLNEVTCVLGAGMYRHYVPPLPAMMVLQPAFLAGYQLSQSELHQGILQLMYEFQELICALTGMEVANSGIYDGASTLAEAVLMAVRLTGKRRVLIARSTHPETRSVLRTYAQGIELAIDEVPFDQVEGTLDLDRLQHLLADDVACVVAQQPNFFGVIESLGPIAEAAHTRDALAIAIADPIALALLRPPGEAGFDLVVGDGQPLGHASRLGGAHFGYLAARANMLPTMPGLYVRQGQTIDGQPGYTLAQQAKSPRSVLREKATSNVGTSAVIPALIGAAYLATMGPEGLRRAAQLSQQRALAAAEGLSTLPGCHLRFQAPFFREFALQTSTAIEPQQLEQSMLKAGIIGPYPLKQTYSDVPDSLLFCFTEMNNPGDADHVAQAMANTIGVAS